MWEKILGKYLELLKKWFLFGATNCCDYRCETGNTGTRFEDSRIVYQWQNLRNRLWFTDFHTLFLAPLLVHLGRYSEQRNLKRIAWFWQIGLEHGRGIFIRVFTQFSNFSVCFSDIFKSFCSVIQDLFGNTLKITVT